MSSKPSKKKKLSRSSKITTAPRQLRISSGERKRRSSDSVSPNPRRKKQEKGAPVDRKRNLLATDSIDINIRETKRPQVGLISDIPPHVIEQLDQWSAPYLNRLLPATAMIAVPSPVQSVRQLPVDEAERQIMRAQIERRLRETEEEKAEYDRRMLAQQPSIVSTERIEPIEQIEQRAIENTLAELPAIEGHHVYVFLEGQVRKLESWSKYIPFSERLIKSLRTKIYFIKFYKLFQKIASWLVKALFCYDVFPDLICSSVIALVAFMMYWTSDTVYKCIQASASYASSISVIHLNVFFNVSHALITGYMKTLLLDVTQNTSSLEKLQLAQALSTEIPQLLEQGFQTGARIAILSGVKLLGATAMSQLQQNVRQQALALPKSSLEQTNNVVFQSLEQANMAVLSEAMKQDSKESNDTMWSWLFGSSKPSNFDSNENLISWTNYSNTISQVAENPLTLEEQTQMTTDVMAHVIDNMGAVVVETKSGDKAVELPKAVDVYTFTKRVSEIPVVAIQELTRTMEQSAPTLFRIAQKAPGRLMMLEDDIQDATEKLFTKLQMEAGYTQMKLAKDFQSSLIPGWMPDYGAEYSKWLSTKEIVYPIFTVQDPFKERLIASGRDFAPDVEVGLVGIQATGVMLCGFMVLFVMFCKVMGWSFRKDKKRN